MTDVPEPGWPNGEREPHLQLGEQAARLLSTVDDVGRIATQDPLGAITLIVQRAATSLGAEGVMITWRSPIEGWPDRVQHGRSAVEVGVLDLDAPTAAVAAPSWTMAAEVRSGDAVHGSMVAVAPDVALGSEARRVLDAHARLAALVVELHLSAVRSARRAQTASYLLELVGLVDRTPSRGDLLELVAATARAMLGAAVVAVLLPSDESEAAPPRLRAVARTDGIDEEDSVDALRSLLASTAVVEALAQGVVEVISRERLGAAGIPALELLGGCCLGVIPLSTWERPSGMALVVWATRALADDPDVRLRLQGLASFGSVVIEGTRMLAQMQHQASHDDLTGLANRHLFADRVDRALASARRHHRQVGIVYLDLDGFKHVNDTLGHEMGDDLLAVIGARLIDALREEDTLARLGGDEFAVLLPELDSADSAMAVAEKIRSSVSEPVELSGRRLHVSPSIGVVLFPEDGDHREDLMRHADLAMYRAKAAGRDAVMRFTPELAEAAEAALGFEDDLRRAIEESELHLLYQPQVETSDGSISGLEALVRWEHPQRGTLPAGEFLEAAEETGLVVALDTWVIAQACRDLQRWRADGLPIPRLAVNISAADLSDAAFLRAFDDILLRTGVKHSTLELEISDGLPPARWEAVAATLAALRDLGVRLAVDDFGSRRSVLGQLRTVPVDTVKIDRDFVAEIDRGDHEPGSLLVDGIVALARTLGMRTVAEGVETASQRSYLSSIGCDAVQGWFYAEPVDAEVVAALLERHPVTGPS